jgi:hypothetical protein
MPQLQLPIFPSGTKEINQDVGVQCQAGKVVYLHGHLPVYQHEETDLKSFRLFTSQMVANGTARAREVVEAFGVPMGTVKRYVSLFRTEGGASFYASKARVSFRQGCTSRKISGKLSARWACKRIAIVPWHPFSGISLQLRGVAL